MGGGATRERGRPARMLSRSVLLSFPAMRHPATCRRERHGLGRSRVLAPLPVEPGGGDGRGCAKNCAGGTPALPGGLHPMTSSQQSRSIGLCVYSWFVFNNDRQFLLRNVLPGRAAAGPIRIQRRASGAEPGGVDSPPLRATATQPRPISATETDSPWPLSTG